MPIYKFFRWQCAGYGLAILLVIILAIFCAIRTNYETGLRLKVWPEQAPEVSVRVSSSVPLSPAVMFLGDSRMVQWGLSQLGNWRVINAGGGGMTTGQIRLAAPKLLAEFHPDFVLLEAGINDLKFLGLRPEMSSVLISMVVSNISVIISECEKFHCKVIVLETWPAGKPDLARRLVWNAAISRSVDELNAHLRLLDSSERGVYVVNLLREAGMKPDAGMYLDTLHFKPEVYQQLTPWLQKELTAVSGK